jgi:hypothetical protein
MKEDAVLTSSQLHFLVLSIGASNAEPSSRCPHCRPLRYFFSSTLLHIYIDYVFAHTYERRREQRARE